MSDMPIGACPICDEQLDHSDAGFCDQCGCGFCWSHCGGWEDNKHICDGCAETPGESNR